MTSATIYQEIAQRTGGDIYLGVVGPVRTGKSTLIKQFLEQLVLPNIDDPYRRQRAQDELPQSGSGKTIMTAEPKFIPEEAVTVSPDGTAQLSVRMIDSVGYLIPNAAGATEDGQTRMVTTPWADHEIPLTEAAELGTKKGHRRALHRRNRRHDRRQRHGVQPSRLSGGRAPRHHGPARPRASPSSSSSTPPRRRGARPRPCARA